MSRQDSDKPQSLLQRLADFAGLIFRAMGSEMGCSSEEVIREERREKSRRFKSRREDDEDGDAPAGREHSDSG